MMKAPAPVVAVQMRTSKTLLLQSLKIKKKEPSATQRKKSTKLSSKTTAKLSTSAKRIRKELAEITLNPPPNCRLALLQCGNLSWMGARATDRDHSFILLFQLAKEKYCILVTLQKSAHVTDRWTDSTLTHPVQASKELTVPAASEEDRRQAPVHLPWANQLPNRKLERKREETPQEHLLPPVAKPSLGLQQGLPAQLTHPRG
ncbi:uncharacterized protein LOC125615966 isoform X1 [Marmota marmota marmota]|uniref:uncharacterized protein LOC125615966 isoform X1 n=1 Tax=Marmota marmota marmota TaxID=9994 RepID=UPI002093CC01|nr:uncharacterized protein LOC125615966 isoform X1 [Marmota marmota marmota]